MRLDRFISNNTIYSRTEAKKIIKKGVIINGNLVKDVAYNIDEDRDIVEFNNEVISYKKNIYIMLNKPAGYVTATEDTFNKTVLDLILEKDKILSPFPVGRLDKDTEGLIFITNDGELAHNLLAPNKNINKKYYVKVDGLLNNDIVNIFKEGVVIDNDYKCKSAELEILSNSVNESIAYITITEGKFHQIKKMMRAVNLNVIYLKRMSIGTLILDEKLGLGKYRYLLEEEINSLKRNK